MKSVQPVRGLRVQSPSLTRNKGPARSRSDAGTSRQDRRDLIAILRDAGVGRQRVNRCADEVERLQETVREIESRAVADVIRGWI